MAALEEVVVVAAAEQVTTATAELTAAPAQVQVPMDLTAATAEVQAAADAGSSQYRQQRMQATEEWHKAAVAAEMAVEEQVAVEQAVSVVGCTGSGAEQMELRVPVCSRVVGGLTYRMQGVKQQVQ